MLKKHFFLSSFFAFNQVWIQTIILSQTIVHVKKMFGPYLATTKYDANWKKNVKKNIQKTKDHQLIKRASENFITNLQLICWNIFSQNQKVHSIPSILTQRNRQPSLNICTNAVCLQTVPMCIMEKKNLASFPTRIDHPRIQSKTKTQQSWHPFPLL